MIHAPERFGVDADADEDDEEWFIAVPAFRELSILAKLSERKNPPVSLLQKKATLGYR